MNTTITNLNKLPVEEFEKALYNINMSIKSIEYITPINEINEIRTSKYRNKIKSEYRNRKEIIFE